MQLLRSISNLISPDRGTLVAKKTPDVLFSKALCSQTQNPILMRFQHVDNSWLLTSSVAYSFERSRLDFSESIHIAGYFDTDNDYRGCHYCKSSGYAMCRCGKISCWNFIDGNPVPKLFKCPWCGKSGFLNNRISNMSVSKGS